MITLQPPTAGARQRPCRRLGPTARRRSARGTRAGHWRRCRRSPHPGDRGNLRVVHRVREPAASMAEPRPRATIARLTTARPSWSAATKAIQLGAFFATSGKFPNLQRRAPRTAAWPEQCGERGPLRSRHCGPIVVRQYSLPRAEDVAARGADRNRHRMAPRTELRAHSMSCFDILGPHSDRPAQRVALACDVVSALPDRDDPPSVVPTCSPICRSPPSGASTRPRPQAHRR